MKLLIFINSDIYCAKVLRLLQSELSKHDVRLVLSRKVGNIDGLAQDLLDMRAREYCEVEKFFSYQSYFYENVNSAEARAEFKKFAPNLIISIRFGQIMQSDLIAIPSQGVINLHSGILPKYRGVLASFWSILNDEKNLGATLHYIKDAGIDTGEIIAWSQSEIDYNSSLIRNIERLYDNAFLLILDVLQRLNNHEKINSINQKNLGQTCYFSYPKKDDLEKFKKIMRLW